MSPFWSPSYSGPGSYDVSYMYTYAPSPEQQSIARKRIMNYLLAVQKGKQARENILVHILAHKNILVAVGGKHM